MMSSILLQVESLHIDSGQGPVVHDLSFSIGPGEIIALTGKSGSGKTSVALAILGMLPSGLRQSSGSITWFGDPQKPLRLPEDLERWHTLRGVHIGYTQQDVFGVFDPVLRMGEQMILAAKERSQKSVEEIEMDLRIRMEEAGLHDIDRLWISYPHQLSGGQLQRCQICMAMVIQPELILADEPTSAIDKINQIELLDVFDMLRKKYNTAIICITHEEAVIRYLADREIRMDVISLEPELKEASQLPYAYQESMAVVEVKQLVFTHQYGGMMYKQGATVGPLDFKVYRGSCLGVIGESGSGKSTLAQLLVGLYKPLAGEVVLHGRKVDFTKPVDLVHLRNHIQLVMQDGRGSLHPYFTIRRILDEVVKQKKKQDAAYGLLSTEVIKVVGLNEDVLDRRPASLSGGECLRISIARALLMEPEVLICDESTSALDGKTRDGILSLLSGLMESGKISLVFISHDERIIRGLAHDLLVLADGKVVEKGPASQILRYPTHHVTQQIFSSGATLKGKRNL